MLALVALVKASKALAVGAAKTVCVIDVVAVPPALVQARYHVGVPTDGGAASAPTAPPKGSTLIRGFHVMPSTANPCSVQEFAFEVVQ